MNPLLIVFLKLPLPGQVKTRLAQSLGTEKALAIYHALVREIGSTLSECSTEDLAVCYSPAHETKRVRHWLTPDAFTRHPIQHWWPQPEADLGERQAWAIDQAFARGYDRVALIGTDCVDMDNALFQEMWAALDLADWVFGPARDGGYYLGATKPGAPEARTIFQNVRWSSEHTLEDCLDALRASDAKVTLLKTLVDIDHYQDWLSVEDRVRL